MKRPDFGQTKSRSELVKKKICFCREFLLSHIKLFFYYSKTIYKCNKSTEKIIERRSKE